jgi:hypothetical protein
VIDVRFTPDATKLLRSSQMTRSANRVLTHRSVLVRQPEAYVPRKMM